MPIRPFACAIALVGSMGIATCQTPTAPAFDVASVKVSAPDSTYYRQFRANSVELRHVTLASLLANAYSRETYPIAGPGWISTEVYDVSAKSAGEASQAELQQMLQRLLQERFELVLHHETRQLHGYVLTAGKSGLKIAAQDGGTRRFITVRKGRINSDVASMAELAQRLGWYFRCPVRDETKTPGLFKFVLEWTVDDSSFGTVPVRTPDDAAGLTVFDALQKTLGLNLEAETVPVDVLVVDKGNKIPAEN